MFINLLIVSREIRQNIEKSTYLPSCAHSLKSTSRFDLGYGDSEEEVLRSWETKLNPVEKEIEKENPVEDDDEGIYDEDGKRNVWLEIYENSINCNYYNCYCE